MATMTLTDTGMDMPDWHCSNCDMHFGIMWPRNPIYDHPKYCPFCGEKIDEYVDHTEGMEE